jgi:hypothetical protein
MNQGVLVVDDDPRLVRVVAMYLGIEGFEVDTAVDAEAALTAIERQCPDLVILDIMMGGMRRDRRPGRRRLSQDKLGQQSGSISAVLKDDRGGLTRKWLMGETRSTYFPVTLDRCDHIEGPFYHGTKFTFEVGEELVPAGAPTSRTAAFQQRLLRCAAGHSRLGSGVGHCARGERGTGAHLRRRARGSVRGRPQRDQQEVARKSHAVLPPRHPLRVVGEVETWKGHEPEVLKGMLDHL